MVNQKIFSDEKLREEIVKSMTYEQKYALIRTLMDNVGKGTFRNLIGCLHFKDYIVADSDLKLMDLNNIFYERYKDDS